MSAERELLDLFLELQVLDRTPRAGFMQRGVDDPESVSEHSWHVVFLVWSLARRIGGIDAERAVGIALVHDLAEVRIGDLPATAASYFAAGAKKEAEARALDEILAPLPADARALYDEYQRGTSPEARLVKACDKLQLMIKVAAYERWQTGWLDDFWDNPDNFADGGFAEVRALYEELLRRRPTLG